MMIPLNTFGVVSITFSLILINRGLGYISYFVTKEASFSPVKERGLLHRETYPQSLY